MNRSMNAKVLSPSRVDGIAAVPAAICVATKAGVYPAARRGREDSAFRLHRLVDVAGKSTVISDWYQEDDSAQAGGNDPGP